MKGILLILIIIGLILFISFETETEVSSSETAKKTMIDSPRNTYETRIEAQNIANTLQSPVSNNYLNSRVNAKEMSKSSVQEANQRIQAQDKALEAFIK